MPDTRITKDRLKNHWMYSSWKYLLMVIIFIAGWNLIYSITAYKPPREKRLEVYMLSSSYVQDNITTLEQEMTEHFVGGNEGDMEEFSFLTISYGDDDATYGAQVLMTRLAALEGDIYMVDEATFSSLISQELALPLDEYIESGALNVEGYDLATVRRNEPATEDVNGNAVYSGVSHIYALPAEPMYGLIEDNIVDNRGMYFVVMAYTDKPDTCIEFLNVMTERFKADKPEWLVEQEEAKKNEIANLPSELTVQTAQEQKAAAATEEPVQTEAPAGSTAAATAEATAEATQEASSGN